MVLVVPPVETSTTGRPLLAPGEVEHMLMDADGRAILTSRRLLWLPSDAAHPSLSLLLVTLLAPELRASVSSLLTIRKLTMGVLCAADGTPLVYGSSVPGQLPIECRVTLLCKDKANHVNLFHARLLQLHQEALNMHTAADNHPSPATAAGPLAAGSHPPAHPSPPPAANPSPAASLAHPTQSTHDRDALLAQLLSMGFGEHPAAHAARATASVDAALEWLLAREGDPLLDLPPSSTQYSGARVQGAGVAGLLQREERRAAATDQSLDQAFRDLDALMAQAGEMVALAQRFRGQLLAAKGDEDAEARALEDDLVAMGIANPVTRDAAGKAYHRELARELGDVLAPQVAKSGGMMTLPDVYCLFNRARGAELVSPNDMLQAAAHLTDVGAGLQLHTLPSGLVVVQSTAFSTAQVAAKLVTLMHEMHAAQSGGAVGADLGPALTAPEVGSRLGVPVTIAGEWLLAAEAEGVLCRDDGVEGLRFFRNFFEEIAL